MDQNTEAQLPEKINVGGQEYSPEELDRLVGLGKIGAEAEERYNVKIDKIWPNHQQTINDKQRLEQELQELKTSQAQQLDKKQQDGAELSMAEQRELAKKQARELDIVTKEDFAQYYREQRAAEKLLDDCESVIASAKDEEKPETSTENLLKYMAENGVRSPQVAYKLMFESELDAIKEKKLSSLRQPGLITQSGSTAGSKSPAPTKVTSENLEERLRAVLSGGQ